MPARKKAHAIRAKAKPKAKPKPKARARTAAPSAAPKGPPGAGVFVWHELASLDVEASKRFYSGLFGWTTHEMPVSGGETYTLFHRGGADIAGCMASQGHGRASPPMWLLYVAVEDVDASASKARSLGAQFVVEPTDIPGIGRFSVLMDPKGASFGLFKPAM